MIDRWYSNPTQIYFTCRELALGRTLNHMDVIGHTRGWRLGAIVHRLKTEYGWPIRTEFRGPEHIGHYSLAPGFDPMTLSLPPSAERLAGELQERRSGGDGGGASNG